MRIVRNNMQSEERLSSTDSELRNAGSQSIAEEQQLYIVNSSAQNQLRIMRNSFYNNSPFRA